MKKTNNTWLWLYYLKQPKLILTSITITPDRYFTILGLIIALYGMSFFTPPVFVIFIKNITGFTIPQIKTILWCTTLFSLLFLAPILSFILTRKDTNNFTKVLSNSVATDKLIRFLALEILHIVQPINAQITGDDIRKTISSKKNALRTVESLKGVLATRLMISHRELSDDFLQFSATVYINRQIYRASLLDYEQYLISKNEPSQEIAIRAHHTKDTLKPIEKHLYSLIKTKMDLKKIEFMFQTRSVSAITQYYISILDIYRKKLFQGKHNNFELFFNIQKSHRTGVAIYRSIGMAIMIYLYKLKKFHATSPLGDSGEIKKELLIRMRSVVGQKPKENELDGLKNWLIESQKFAAAQRKYICRRAAIELIKRIKNIKRRNQKNGVSNGKIYIVLANYSRIVRYIFDSVVTREKEFNGIFKDISVVISVQSEVENTFDSRLMFHHITNENNKKNSTLGDRTWRSTPAALMSVFNEKKDHIIVISSADRIGHEQSSERHRDFLKNKKHYHWHNNIAYLSSPITLLNEYRKTANDEINNTKLDVLVVGGNYKYDLEILINQFGDSQITNELRTPKRKRRHSGLYQWKSNKDFNVKIVSVALPSLEELLPELSNLAYGHVANDKIVQGTISQL